MNRFKEIASDAWVQTAFGLIVMFVSLFVGYILGVRECFL